jgi:hypothetical protein
VDLRRWNEQSPYVISSEPPPPMSVGNLRHSYPTKGQQPEARANQGGEGDEYSATELVRQAVRRERLQRATRNLLVACGIATLLAIPVMLLAKRGWYGAEVSALTIGVCSVLAIGFALIRSRHKLPELTAAVALDHASEKPHDMLRSSYEFEQIPETERGAYTDLHLARHRTFSVSTVTRAFPWAFPKSLWLCVLAGACLGLAQLWSPPTTAGFQSWQPPPPTPEESFVSASTLFEREQLEQLREDVESADNEALSEAFDELSGMLDELESGSDEEDILDALSKMQNELDDLAVREPAALDDALREAAEELRKSEETNALADALERESLDEAAKELERIGESLDSRETGEANESREDMADALREASEALSPLDRQAERALAQAERQAERAREQARDNESQEAQEEAEAAQRELERLERERQQSADQQGTAESRREELSRSLRRLSREAQRQARERSGSQGGSEQQRGASEAAQQGAEQLRRQSQERSASSAREGLRRRAESMRESVRRSSQQQGQGSDGADRAEDMRDYLRRAGADVDSLPRSGQQGGTDQSGASRSEERERRLRQLQRERQGSGQSTQASGEQTGQSQQQGSGDGIGEGHQDNDFLNPTERRQAGDDVRLRGTPDGDGPSTAEIIMGAEDGGFSGVPYREVYQHYSQIRESATERESIPSGYRSYVERYFELISPRTGRR